MDDNNNFPLETAGCSSGLGLPGLDPNGLVGVENETVFNKRAAVPVRSIDRALVAGLADLDATGLVGFEDTLKKGLEPMNICSLGTGVVGLDEAGLVGFEYTLVPPNANCLPLETAGCSSGSGLPGLDPNGLVGVENETAFHPKVAGSCLATEAFGITLFVVFLGEFSAMEVPSPLYGLGAPVTLRNTKSVFTRASLSNGSRIRVFCLQIHIATPAEARTKPPTHAPMMIELSFISDDGGGLASGPEST